MQQQNKTTNSISRRVNGNKANRRKLKGKEASMWQILQLLKYLYWLKSCNWAIEFCDFKMDVIQW